jgi:hypothetical protein
MQKVLGLQLISIARNSVVCRPKKQGHILTKVALFIWDGEPTIGTKILERVNAETVPLCSSELNTFLFYFCSNKKESFLFYNGPPAEKVSDGIEDFSNYI